MKLALLFFEIFEFEVEGSKSYKCQIKKNEKHFDHKNTKTNGRQIKWDSSIL